MITAFKFCVRAIFSLLEKTHPPGSQNLSFFIILHYKYQGEGREGVETAIHRASPSVMRASRGVRRSNCKQIWLRVHDPSEGMLKLLLYKILLV